ncbi:MAG TPA: DUF47 family protein [Pirellulales bacterium]|jgi:hypothetical protein|nr:DUF47 family protein [Pirellulales bacterium]
MLSFTPKNPKFYDYFDQATDVLVRAAEQFVDFLDHFSDLKIHAQKIKDLEHEGDNIAHETMGLLHQSFITPLERGDIRRLIMAIDDVLDFLDDGIKHIVLYDIQEVLPPLKNLAQVLLSAVKGVRKAVFELRNIGRRNEIMNYCIEIHHQEDEGDRIYLETLGWLFKSGLDPLTVIKWKDILDDVEKSIDCCQDVANVVEGIVLENS